MSTLRPFQQQFINVALQKVSAGDPTLVADVHPGSGKTIGALLAANALLEAQVIQKVIIFVPRRNLAEQFELDCRAFRRNFPGTVLGEIHHRENEPPLIRDNASGYVTTYASLASQPGLHEDIFRQYDGRILLICDEAQQLGVATDYEATITKSADIVQQLQKYAILTIVMTGTPERGDNAHILGATYSDADQLGFHYIRPDIQATYHMGVYGGYLRQFEAELVDGKAIWERYGLDPEELVLSELEKGIYRVIGHENYWHELVDRFIDVTRERRQVVDPRLVSLIAAWNQRQARDVEAYIRQRHGDMRTLIAVSDDGESASQNLREFKRGRHDVLITVNMAYVGYDCKPISQILPLTGYRTSTYLRQLIARGLRVMPDIDFESQFCYVVAPNDRAMSEFVDILRQESQRGIKEREERARKEGESKRNPIVPEGRVEDAWVTDHENKSLDPKGDLEGELRDRVIHVVQEHRLPEPPAKFYAAYLSMKEEEGRGNLSPKPQSAPEMTQREREVAARAELHNLANRCDHLVNAEPGTTNKELYSLYGKSVSTCTLDEIQERIRLVRRWIEEATDK